MSAVDSDRAPRPADMPRVVLGTIKAVFGTRGWVKIHSDTRPRNAIFEYASWQVGRRQDWQTLLLQEGRLQGQALLAKLQGIDHGDAAERLLGLRIAVAPADLPPPPRGSYYWRDLIGLEVVNVEGLSLGSVQGLVETGANDVLRVRGDRDRLVPFVMGVYVVDVDLDARRITVDWQADD